MMHKLSVKISCQLMIMIVAVAGQIASAQQRVGRDSCTLASSDVLFPSANAPKPSTPPHEAVVFGKEFRVPELRMRFVDAETGKPVIPKAINVHYYWQWVEWPYPEHAWGAWSDAQDWVKCTTDDDQLVIPAHTVKPRGWYNGKYIKFPYTLSGSKDPKFDRLEIVFEFEKGAPRLIINEKELVRYKGVTAVVKLPYAGRAAVKFE
jgi:hypothetical protein